MEPISGEPTTTSIQNHLDRSPVKPPTIASTHSNTPLDKNGNLNAVSDLTTLARDSSTDIREDVVEKAKKLLDDPNWLSDDSLLNLSSKLLQNENFDS